MAGKLYIETVGCQMNVLDSELVVGSLRRQGYSLSATREEADVVLFNTCSIREHAEEKIYSALGTLRAWKKTRPEAVIGVLGCMAQKDQEGVLKRAPFVDLVAGPGQLADVPDLVEEVRRTRVPALAFGLGRKEAPRREVEASFPSWDPIRDPEMRPTPFQAFVRTQFGCDKFCTYCIVPSVRGPEQGRHPDEMVAEVRRLAEQGVKEVTLIGQTVNSYRFTHGDGRKVRLSDLLYGMHEIPGITRIKFVTNFPNDMSDDLLDAVRDLPRVAKYLHVPAQSGCDEVLARMKRHYTVAGYKEMIARVRERVPEASISGDLIVGFCGETEESFQRTCELVRFGGFKNNFIYQYSTRPGTRAHAELADDIPDEVKKRRNNDLLAVQQEVSRADHRRRIGDMVEILVEGPSKLGRRRGPGSSPGEREGADMGGTTGSGGILQLTGRTTTDHIVVFDGPATMTGRMVQVKIEDASAFTLFGVVEGVDRAVVPDAVPPGRRPSLPVLGS